MNYQFNYGFFEEWLNANPGLKRADMLNALEIQSSNGLNTWRDKERPMPILTILKICNAFQIPLGLFFCDKDSKGEDAQVTIPRYNENMQLEPDGGYSKDRGPGKGAIIDPTAKIIQESAIPERYNMETKEGKPMETDADTSGTEGTKSAGAHSIDLASLLELEKSHAEQRRELMAVIKSQQEQIKELTDRLLGKEERSGHKETRYGIVAEGEETSLH